MPALLSLAALAALVLPGDTLPAPAPAQAMATAYLDAGTRTLVSGARERRQQGEGSIVRYQNLSRSRITIGLGTGRRERLFYRCESAVRVDWHRDAPTRIEVLGGREVVPVVSARLQPETGDCAGAVFDPTEDHLALATGGLVRTDSGFVRHPLAVGSEVDYRFRSGDVTTLRLPSGVVIRLHELELIPRRSDPRLVSGSLWLDEETRAVVRAVLRLARPYDFHIDAGDSDGLPGLLRPAQAELRYMTIEYALWEGRWWLPRLIAYEGEVRAGGLLRLPLRLEQSYTDYRAWSDPAAAPPAAERLAAAPRECRPRRPADEPEDSTRRPPRSVSFGVSENGAFVDTDLRSGCTCSRGRCWEIETVVPRDTALLLTSEHLPPSIYDEGEALMTPGDLERLQRQIRLAAPAPWQLVRPRVRWGLQGLDLVRYNRVEGLSVGARADLDLGRATVDATVRLGTADLVPGVEIGAERAGTRTTTRVAAYQRLETVRPANRALGLGNSVSALLFGRDDGSYFRAAGAELLLAPVGGGAGLTARLFAEHQRSAHRETDLSVASLWRDEVFRENIMADRASQYGGTLGWSAHRGLDPTRLRGSISLAVEGAGGSYRYAQSTATATAAIPLFGGILSSVEVAGGTTFGEVGAQRLWYLGGPATVRGYPGGAAAGESFWRGRVEVARAAPGARIVLFSDHGATYRSDREGAGASLSSYGVGASVLDGLLRLDLARARTGSWRLDFHLDAGL